jgi:Fe-S cluster assembly iron-binding protein IscA
MFQITERAARRLKAALSKAEDAENACFRVGVKDRAVELVVDQQRPGDTTIEHEGEALLVLDPMAGDRLYNRKLDLEEQTSNLVLREVE